MQHRAADDFVLHVLAEFHEERAVPGDAHHQRAVFLGMALGVEQGFVVQIVELHFAVAEHAGRLDQGDEAVFAFLRIQQPGHDLEVVDHADVHVVVGHLGHGFDDRRGALDVRALRRADPVGQRLPRPASVGRRPEELAEGRIVGNGQGPVAENGIQGAVLAVLLLREVDEVRRDEVRVIVVVQVK